MKVFFYFGIKTIKGSALRTQLTLKCFISVFPVVWKKERKRVKMCTKKNVIARTAVRFPGNSSHMSSVELALDRLLCTHYGNSKGFF